MSRAIRYIEPTATVREAAIRMRDENVGFLPVCAPDRRVLGALTYRDIVMGVDVAGVSAALCLVGDVMSPAVTVVGREQATERAEQLIAGQRTGGIIVVDEEGRMCGVIGPSEVRSSRRI